MFKCSKCGFDDIVFRYKESDDDYNERLLCKCKRCEYTWHETPLDKRKNETYKG